MIRCIAIDDEPLALDLLEDNISKVPYLQLIARCDDALEATKVLNEKTVDLVFLDIQMPGLTGLQFIKSITQKPMFILVTAYEKYALEGFDLAVIDYLVKPVALDRFMKACNKAMEYHLLKTKNDSGEKVVTDYLFVNVDYSLLKIMHADIMWVEGLKDYIKIHLRSSSKPVVTRMSMKLIEDILPSAKFIRIHKSYIVAIAYVTAVRKNSVFIGPTEIPVSDTYPGALAMITGRAI
jgi:two-component system LytT family response regulator